jgi:hypothetical protein
MKMFERNSSKSRGFLGWTGAVGMLVVTTIATPALATVDTAYGVTVTKVGVSKSGSLSVQAGNVWYYSGQSIGNCPDVSVSADTLKAWQSQLTAALLSGKSVDIIFDNLTNCQGGTAKWITGITING